MGVCEYEKNIEPISGFMTFIRSGGHTGYLADKSRSPLTFVLLRVHYLRHRVADCVGPLI